MTRIIFQAQEDLTQLESEPLPDEIPQILGLISDHKDFMDELQKKEPDVLSICKPTKGSSSMAQPGKKKSRASMG